MNSEPITDLRELKVYIYDKIVSLVHKTQNFTEKNYLIFTYNVSFETDQMSVC